MGFSKFVELSNHHTFKIVYDHWKFMKRFVKLSNHHAFKIPYWTFREHSKFVKLSNYHTPKIPNEDSFLVNWFVKLSNYHTPKIGFFSFFVKLLSLTFTVISVYFGCLSKLKVSKYILKKSN